MAVRCTKQRDVSARLRQRSSKGVRVVDSRRLASWGAFLSPHGETVELHGRHTKSATFTMWGSGFSCELTYFFWEDDPVDTVRQRIELYRSPRRASRERQVMGYEVMFLRPTCGRWAKRLALLRMARGAPSAAT